MIRIVSHNRIIIPHGDSGIIRMPIRGETTARDLAIFTVYDPLTNSTVIRKITSADADIATIIIDREDTISLTPGHYYYDFCIYHHPMYDDDDELIGALEVDSYYSAYKLPIFCIRRGTNL